MVGLVAFAGFVVVFGDRGWIAVVFGGFAVVFGGRE